MLRFRHKNSFPALVLAAALLFQFFIPIVHAAQVFEQDHCAQYETLLDAGLWSADDHGHKHHDHAGCSVCNSLHLNRKPVLLPLIIDLGEISSVEWGLGKTLSSVISKSFPHLIQARAPPSLA